MLQNRAVIRSLRSFDIAMRITSTFLAAILLCTGLLSPSAFSYPITAPATLQPQIDEVAQAADAETETEESKASAENEDDETVIDTRSTTATTPEIDDRFLRFQMWDGTIVSGIVSISSIDVETEFGKLEIPIQRLVEFRPGLVSLPELRSEVETLVADLGDREFKTRESAHKAIVAMGPMLGQLITEFDDGGDAERKKHLTEIRAEIATMVEEAEDDNESTLPLAVSNGDSIRTPEFSMIGKIQQQEFSVKSKIGDLRIMLGDIQRADRGDVAKSEAVRKTFSVAGDVFFQKTPLSTKIRVSKGDKIEISASGIVQWTNWNKSASPDGLPNQGNWNGISNGTLCARIGPAGKVVSIGSDGEFKADRSGVLYLGVAMADNYVNNSGYKWTGKFKAKVKVEPAN